MTVKINKNPSGWIKQNCFLTKYKTYKYIHSYILQLSLLMFNRVEILVSAKFVYDQFVKAIYHWLHVYR